MNERIKELWVESTKTLFPRNGDYVSVSAKNIEHFSEFIINECLGVCKGQSEYDPSILPYKPSEQFADAIKTHFGGTT